ncbi:DUF5684 domain-containing protein [Glaciibacter superstes]|uniref:DUF5684 domain-containing protein n=1 Tax=Glaciibacter superstes TaxID=501023 RepID=UPI0003B68235|nr:DUF5684 domain-containing protein [Glaciibacter superstes]
MSPPSDPSALIGVLVVGYVVFALVGIAVYVWTALALSRLFPRLGGESWKGWVPILNTAEILRLGGVPAWSVVFLFIPLVNLYGVYLYIVAAHRINLQFGRGAGSTVLAVLLQPVWASLLAWGSDAADAQRGLLVSAQPVAARPMASQPVVTQPPLDNVAPSPAFVPVRIGAVPWGPPPATVDEPHPVNTVAPRTIALNTTAPHPAGHDPSVFDTIITRAPFADSDAADDIDDIEATIVVDRRPRVRWRLVLEDGTAFDLTAASVVLGRNPVAANPAEQRLVVPDTTRTLSKTHARLELADGAWRVTDLSSTNGVLVVDESGVEVLIDPWTPVEIGESFVLGVVGMHLTSTEISPA